MVAERRDPDLSRWMMRDSWKRSWAMQAAGWEVRTGICFGRAICNLNNLQCMGQPDENGTVSAAGA